MALSTQDVLKLSQQDPLSTTQVQNLTATSAPQVAPVAQPITPSSLTSATPIDVPPAPIPTPINMGGVGEVIKSNDASLSQSANTDTPTVSSDFQSMLKSLTDSYSPPPSVGEAPIATSQLNDVNAAQSAENTARDKYNALNAQLQQYNYNASTLIPAAVQENAIGKMGTGAANAITASELRKNALAAAPIQFQALIAQGELAAAQGKTALAQGIYQQAQNHLDAVFTAHQTDATNQFNYQMNLKDKAFTMATDAQKQRLADQKAQLTTNHSDLMDVINSAQALSTSATSNGQADIAAKLTALTPPDINSKTFSADLTKYRAQISLLQGQIVSKSAKPDTQTVDVGGRKLLIDSQTGVTIKDLGTSTTGQGTQAERAASAISQFGNAFVPGAKLPSGIPVLDIEGKLTPEAFKAAIADAPSEGITRTEFLKEFGSFIVGADGLVSTKYGLTPKEIEDLKATAK